MDKETFQPLPNLPKSGLLGKLIFPLRLFFDLQVNTVHGSLGDFFRGRNQDKVLEVGGGLSPYRHLIKTSRYWSLEPYQLEKEFGYLSESIKYDGANFPFKSDSFDVVFHTEVIEHVYDTGFFLQECARVLKPQGSMFFTVPFSARYHYQPYDYWRFTPSTLKLLCASHGFEVSSLRPRGDSLVVICNKIMVFVLGMAMGGRSGVFSRIMNRVVGIPLAVLLLPILAVIGQFCLRTGWVQNTDDCLGYSVICVKTASKVRPII